MAGALFGWILVALAALDLRHFWLPDRLVLALVLLSIASWWLGLAPSGADRLLGALGGYFFGEKGQVIGEEVGALIGSTWLGGKGEKLGAKLEARLPPGVRATARRLGFRPRCR